MVNRCVLQWTRTITHNIQTTMNTSSQEYVYRKFDELKTAIRWDTFNLTRSQQEILENKLAELRKQMEEYYVANVGE